MVIFISWDYWNPWLPRFCGAMWLWDRRQSAGPKDPSFCVDGREVASSGLEALSGAKLDGITLLSTNFRLECRAKSNGHHDTIKLQHHGHWTKHYKSHVWLWWEGCWSRQCLRECSFPRVAGQFPTVRFLVGCFCKKNVLPGIKKYRTVSSLYIPAEMIRIV